MKRLLQKLKAWLREMFGGAEQSAPPVQGQAPRAASVRPGGMMNPYSNAPSGYPDTSNTGYPLFYSLGGDGLPVGAPRLWYDGQTFADEAEIAYYKARSKMRDENLEKWQQQWAAQVFTGPIPAGGATIEDARFVRYWSDRDGRNHWYDVFGGSNVEINRLINASHPLPFDYDQAAYAGRARSVLGKG